MFSSIRIDKISKQCLTGIDGCGISFGSAALTNRSYNFSLCAQIAAMTINLNL